MTMVLAVAQGEGRGKKAEPPWSISDPTQPSAALVGQRCIAGSNS